MVTVPCLFIFCAFAQFFSTVCLFPAPELNEETLPTLLLISKLMKVNLDKLYILTVNHVFKNKLMPLLLDQMKHSQGHGPSKDTNTVIQNIFKDALCIQNLELAAATMHKISQDLPAGRSSGSEIPRMRTSLHLLAY
ncbi:kinetochore-associated protein 1-like [Ictalurus punctatus]|uniref:Kinetochore-associated protein 1-like n=1 Tax=Ictalurus punctatus TaxID=7998 RepID=A0A979EFP7_ICTPU|nr:kinetochore-associated protein 1-like [Ictalurus punctatus]